MTLQTLISVDELAARVGDARLIVADCRFQLGDPTAGARAWREAHIPGAIHADLDRHLSDLTREGLGRHPLPFDDAFSAWLSHIGWTPEHAVVACDDAGGAMAAARLWWLLRLTGHGDVAVLDGGIGAWKAAGLPLTTETSPRQATTVDVRLPPVRFDRSQTADYREVADGLASNAIVLVDARGGERFRGDVEPIDKVAGHVPGAINRPFPTNLDASNRFKDARQLRREWLELIGPHQPDAVVHMCGSGVSACHNLLAMEHAGLPGSRLFAPSWSGWIDDPSRPIARG